MLRRLHDMDRPTNNTLIYLTKVRPHPIKRDDQLRDPYVEEALRYVYSEDIVGSFKEYTRSFYTLEGHYANLWLYDRPFLDPPLDPLYYMAASHTREVFRLEHKVPSISWSSLASVPYIRTSSAGWGYDGKKGDLGNHELAIKRAVRSLRSWEERQQSWRYTPDVAWTRTQLGTFEAPKIRNVWGKAFHNIILEGMTAYPLIEAYQNMPDSPIVTGIHLYKRLPVLTHSVLHDDEGGNYGVGIDFKSFDTSPQPWLINTAFDILRENIEFTDVEGRSSFEYSREFFINTPIIMPDGRMWLKRIGIPSGSYFTQLIGSVINHIIISYIQLQSYGRFFKTYVLGDDSVFGQPIGLGPPDVAEFASIGQKLDFTIHPHKVVVALRPQDLEFLGHVTRGLRVDRETAKLLRLALYPEYPVLSPDMSLSRMKGILIDSGLNSWRVLDLVHWMSVLFNTGGGATFAPEQRNWLESVCNMRFTPEEVDVLKAWTVT